MGLDDIPPGPLEDAAQLTVGVFKAIAAAVEDVNDWLKALFDFAAIWNTKMALEALFLHLAGRTLRE